MIYSMDSQKNRGPDMASLCLSEALNEASDLKINLVIVSLDTMKAFDVVPHDFLLYRLYHRNTHPSIWKIMDSLLSGQTEKALWGASESEHYPIKQGSGQGKVMGAPLFKVHIHPLLEQLTSLDVGFRIGNIAIGHPTCADDLLLITDSVPKAQIMCDAVHYMSRQDRSTQQPTKSRILCTRTTDNLVTLDDKKIPSENFFKHVGINRYQKSNDNLINDRTSTCRKTAYSLMPVGIHGRNGLSPFYIRKVVISHIIPRTIHGIHTITLTQTQREKLDSSYATLLKNLQGLRKQTATAAAYLFMGLLPLTAELDKRALSLYGSITRMKENEPLKELARRQFGSKGLGSKSWFIYIYKIGLQYNIDIIAALDLNWSKQEWKEYVKKSIWSYHKEKLKLEAAGKKSLERVTLDNISMKGTHQIWPKRLEGKMDPARTTAACIQAKLLTKTYMTQTLLAKYYPSTYTSKCQLCLKEDETIPHFILHCPALSKIRKHCMKYLRKMIKKSEISLPKEQEKLICLILNGSKEINVNKACSNLCLRLHRKRFLMLDEKGLIFRKNKEKKKKKDESKDYCIVCEKEVENEHKAIECDKCKKWQHIRCDKVMNGWKYNRIKKGIELFQWSCKKCI